MDLDQYEAWLRHYPGGIAGKGKLNFVVAGLYVCALWFMVGGFSLPRK